MSQLLFDKPGNQSAQMGRSGAYTHRVLVTDKRTINKLSLAVFGERFLTYVMSAHIVKVFGQLLLWSISTIFESRTFTVISTSDYYTEGRKFVFQRVTVFVKKNAFYLHYKVGLKLSVFFSNYQVVWFGLFSLLCPLFTNKQTTMPALCQITLFV